MGCVGASILRGYDAGLNDDQGTLPRRNTLSPRISREGASPLKTYERALKAMITAGADMPSPQRVFSQKYLKVDKTIV